MKISRKKLDLILAQKELSLSNLKFCVSSGTLQKAKSEKDIRPVIVGRIAKALGVDPAEIIETEE